MTLLPAKFGIYGGQFVPETLMPALIELEEAFVSAKADVAFQKEFNRLMASYVGRPTPLTYAKRLSEKLGGAQIYLKREDLAHTGAHKINNALGQALLVKRMGKRRIVAETGRLPDTIIACVGGGSNAIGVFSGFVNDDQVELIGVEAGGSGIETGKHAARFGDPAKGRIGVIHGTRTYVLQDEDGQIAETHSVSAGLDYAAVGPEHAMMRDNERAFYTSATDEEALNAFQVLCHTEGIIPALESSHAVAEVIKRAPKMKKDQVILVNLSGRGDKDLNTVIKEMNRE